MRFTVYEEEQLTIRFIINLIIFLSSCYGEKVNGILYIFLKRREWKIITLYSCLHREYCKFCVEVERKLYLNKVSLRNKNGEAA